MKKYSVVGNKKKVTMETNSTRLKVVGNSCFIKVAINHGEIEVVGNDCTIEVTYNYGSINIVGGNSTVKIERRSKGDVIQMVGPSNYMIVDGMKSSQSYEAQLSPFSKDLDDVIDSIFTFVMR